MCVPLFMYKIGLINSPMFYISAFFERRREEYYERLLAISRDDDWTGWCKFFLNAVLDQANENYMKVSKILKLYEEMKNRISKLTRSPYSIHTLDFIFSRLIFKSTDFTKSARIPTPTAKRILAILRENKILTTLQEPSGRQSAIYMFGELLRITEGDDET